MKKILLLTLSILSLELSNAQVLNVNNDIYDVSYKSAPANERANFHTIVSQKRAAFQTVMQNDFTRNEMKAYKQFERWAYFWKDRVSADGTFPSALQGYENANVFSAVNNRRSGSTDIFTNIGPKVVPEANGYTTEPQLGRINTFWRFVDANAAANNVLLVGAPTGGIWKSNDNGATWSPKFDKFAGIGITDIKGTSSLKGTPGVLYASTGDLDGSEVLNSIGVYKSTDMGETWVETGLKFGLDAKQLTGHIAVFDAMTVVVGTRDAIKRTTDGGATWTDVFAGTINNQFFGRMATSGNKAVCTDGVNGVYYTGDKGATWAIIQNPIDDDAKHAVCADENGDFFVQDKNGQMFKVDIANKDLIVFGAAPANYNSQGGYNQALVKRGSLIISNEVGGFSSADAGNTWYLSLNGYKYETDDPGVYIHSDHHQTGYLDNGLSFWNANDGGLNFVTYTDKNDQEPTNEYKSNGVIVTQIYTISINPKTGTNDDFMMANQDNDGFSKEDGKWVAVSAGDGVCSAIDYTDPSIRYMGGTNGSLTRSTETLGYTDNYQGIQLTTPGNAEFVWPLNLHTTTSSTLYGGFDELYVSTDKGDNWATLNSGAGKILQFDNQGNSIAVIGTDGTLRFSSDAGSTWSDMNLPDANNGVNSFSIDASSTDGKTIYATVKGYTDGSKIYKTTNAGLNWTNISNNLPNIIMKKVLFKQNSTDVIIFVATELGVYVTDDAGSYWARMGANLPNVIVNDMKINYINDKLYIGTYGRGMWESTATPVKDGIGINDLNKNNLFVYPNPISDGNLNVNVEDNSNMDYIIYNVVGGVILKGSVSQSNNSISTKGIQAGTYMIKLSNGKEEAIQKIIIE